MKKLYTAALALLLSLYGCSAQTEMSEFKGVITEKSDSGLVTVESTGGDIEKGSLVSFSTANLADNGAKVGDTVVVAFDGEIAETYPLQITASGWDLVLQSEVGAVAMSVYSVTPEGCKVTFTNGRDVSYNFFGYKIEKKIAGGSWEPINDEYYEDESSWKVGPGCSTEIKLNWKDYCGDLPKGKYRLVYQYLCDGKDKALLLSSEFTV